jgi:hypothetical protein
MKLSKKKLESFVQAQLMTLIALELVETHANVGFNARRAIGDAKAIAASALDQLVKDYPKVESWIDKMTKNLSTPHEEPANGTSEKAE